MPNLTNSQEPEPGVFGSLEPEPLEEKKPGAGAAWEKNQKPEPLEKKSGAGAAKKNLPAPQPCFKVSVALCVHRLLFRTTEGKTAKETSTGTFTTRYG